MKTKAFAVLLLLVGFQAQAALLTFSDRTAFQSAAGGSLTLEDFADGTLATGVSLATGGGVSIFGGAFSNCPTGGQCLGVIETASLTFSFSPGVRAVGFDYNELNLASLGYADSAGNTISAALTANGFSGRPIPNFFGVVSDVDLTSVTIGTGTDAGGALYFVDSLEFGGRAVPEPTTLALLGLGLAGLAATRRRKQ